MAYERGTNGHLYCVFMIRSELYPCNRIVMCLDTQVLEADHLGLNPFTYHVTLGKLHTLSMFSVLSIN